MDLFINNAVCDKCKCTKFFFTEVTEERQMVDSSKAGCAFYLGGGSENIVHKFTCYDCGKQVEQHVRTRTK